MDFFAYDSISKFMTNDSTILSLTLKFVKPASYALSFIIGANIYT